MIDPQNQANRFIKNLAKDPEFAPMGIESVKASDSKLMKVLERAVQNGKWFLCENVGEDLDPSLEPILLK
jgi:dynein heavy chain, axonemal